MCPCYLPGNIPPVAFLEPVIQASRFITNVPLT